MSFINLMDDVVWDEAQINAEMREIRRRSGYGDDEWEFLAQKMFGYLIGLVPEFSDIAYPLSADEKAEIRSFAGVLYQVQVAGRAARADMATKAAAMAIEAGADASGAPQPVLDLLAARAAARPNPEPQP